jgi:hypothetical protein
MKYYTQNIKGQVHKRKRKGRHQNGQRRQK